VDFDRRTIVQGALATGASALAAAAEAQTAHPPRDAKFSYDEVVKRATQLAAAPYQAQLPPIPDELNKLDWDAWSQISFKDSKALLSGNGSQFRLELYHLGYLFKRPIVINTLRDGIPTPIPYQAGEFNFGSTKFNKPLPVNLGFAGFKIWTPLNDPKKYDEFISFIGSSYFRFLGRGQRYGLSARGLAVNGGTNQEEFPFYREFWIETPQPEIDKVTIYALLDSAAATGAFQFDCYPKENSVVDVRATLIPRRDDVKLGLMPLTSMFYLGENGPVGKDDYRFELHDSDGLFVHNGAGEWLWRPLRNPNIAKTTAFLDKDVKGFGLLQRDRSFSHYEDLDLAYQLRPSYWVAANTKLGEGHVELFEMPTTDESNDNIVASWVSADKPPVGKPLEYSYSITSALELDRLTPLGRTIRTFQTSARALGSNESNVPTTRRFIMDFTGGDLAYYKNDPKLVKIDASTTVGRIVRSYTQLNPFIDGIRATFDVDVPPGETANLRAFLHDGPNVLTETWTFPWTAPGTPPAPAPAQATSADPPKK
jgi:periplasmic glucans biosynthesis protein